MKRTKGVVLLLAYSSSIHHYVYADDVDFIIEVGIFIKYSRSADDVVCVTVDIFVKCTLCADYVAGNAFNYADDDANC